MSTFDASMLSMDQKDQVARTGGFSGREGRVELDENQQRAANPSPTNPTNQPDTDIPVEAIESDAQGVRLPTQPEMSDTVAGARSAAEQVMGDFQRDTEAREAQARERVDEGEQAILESLGALGTQRQTQQELQSDAGLPEMQTQTRDIANRIQAASRELQEFADETFFRSEQRRDELMGVDAPSAVFNAEQRAFTIQREMQRRQKASNIRTDIAVMETLQGNMEAAERQVQSAMDAIYEPIKTELQMEQFMLERNSQRFSAAQQEAAQARMMGVQSRLQTIERAENAVNEAMQTGVATPDEIKRLSQLAGSPREQQMAAQMITNRAAAEMRGLQISEMEESILASRAQRARSEQVDPVQAMIMGLFAGDDVDADVGGAPSFDQFVSNWQQERGVDLSALPAATQGDAMVRLQQEYDQQVGANEGTRSLNRESQISQLIAVGALNEFQANTIRDYFDIQTPDQRAKETLTRQRAVPVLRDIERALGQVEKSGPFAGWLASGDRIVGQGPALTATMSRAFELRQHLDSIKSNISIDQLQMMREASPTGGALGQIPVKQQEFLMSVLGSLQPTLNSDTLRENLNGVYNTYLDAMFGSPEELSDAVRRGSMTQQKANQLIQQRKQTAYNEFNLTSTSSFGEDISRTTIAPDGSLIMEKQ